MTPFQQFCMMVGGFVITAVFVSIIIFVVVFFILNSWEKKVDLIQKEIGEIEEEIESFEKDTTGVVDKSST